MKRKQRLLVLLLLANLLALAPERAPSHLRHQRAAAQAAALARGSRTYTFETTWNPPLLKGDSR